jgi:CubicO group peptidase (beta-lactamase class C family)
MAKLGVLFADGGRWHGRQLVPAAWVHEATSPVVPTGDGPGEHYGYQWWITEADGHPAFAAIGFGGQIIEVVPDLRLVVTASTVISENDVFDATTFEILTSTVIAPAVR